MSLIQKPLITKDVLSKYTKTVAFVDCDSIATPYVDRIFDLYDNEKNYPYFVEGIYDYGYISTFANSKIVLLNNFDSSAKEVYSFSGRNNDDSIRLF